MKREKLIAILGGTLWLYADKLGRAVVGFFIVLWMARILGPQQFGELNFAQSIVTSFLPVAYLGIASLVVKILVQEPENRDELLSASLFLRGLSVIVTIPLLLGFAWGLSSGDQQMMLLVLVMSLCAFSALAEGFESELQVQMNNRLLAVIRLAVFAVSSLLKVMLLIEHASLVWFAVIFAFDSLAVSATILWHRSRHGGLGFIRWCWPMMRRLISIGWPITLVAIIATLHSKVDTLLLGHLQNASDVGVYAAAWKILEVLMFIPMMTMTSMAPTLSELHAQSIDIFQQQLKRAFGSFFWGAIVLAAASALLGDFVIPRFFGAKYAESASVFKVIVWLLPLSLFNLFLVQWTINTGRQRYLLEVNSFGLLSGFGLGYLLIGDFGAIGAAYSVILSYALTFGCYCALRADGRQFLRIQLEGVVWPLAQVLSRSRAR